MVVVLRMGGSGKPRDGGRGPHRRAELAAVWSVWSIAHWSLRRKDNQDNLELAKSWQEGHIYYIGLSHILV